MIDMQRFKREGFVITPSLFSSQEIAQLIAWVESASSSDQKRGGVRDIMHRVPELRATAEHPRVRSIVDRVLSPAAFVVRATLFDKTETSNWKVPWHQDLTIAVRQRQEADGYGPWSTKLGIDHVQPPSEILAQMVSVRIHLDPCPTTNGALRVMPGTHHLGRLNQNRVNEHIDESRAFTCIADAGEALLMSPLLLHTSSPSLVPGHRRVLHFDYASGNLADGLEWRMR